MELKKHDSGYREKQELNVNHGGGVLVAPAEMGSIDDWEARFGKAKDITPSEDEDDRAKGQTESIRLIEQDRPS